MRLITFICLLTLSLGCTSTKKTTAKSGNLNGTWIPVKQEIGGNELPNAAFDKQSLTIKDSNYTFIAESVDKGVVQYNQGKMDIYGKEGVNAGKHITAIYKYENEQLTICYNLTGSSYPQAFITTGKPLLFLSTFKKG
jgi:uncharacterized protein (TIGR03067 family)